MKCVYVEIIDGQPIAIWQDEQGFIGILDHPDWSWQTASLPTKEEAIAAARQEISRGLEAIAA